MGRAERRRRAREQAKKLQAERPERQPGKQPGDPGAYLAKVPDPDRMVVHVPGACAGCGAGLEAAAVCGTAGPAGLRRARPAVGGDRAPGRAPPVWLRGRDQGRLPLSGQRARRLRAGTASGGGVSDARPARPRRPCRGADGDGVRGAGVDRLALSPRPPRSWTARAASSRSSRPNCATKLSCTPMRPAPECQAPVRNRYASTGGNGFPPTPLVTARRKASASARTLVRRIGGIARTRSQR